MQPWVVLLSVLVAPLLGMLALQAGWLTGTRQLWQMLLFAWPASMVVLWLVLSVIAPTSLGVRKQSASWSALSKIFHWLMALCILGAASLMYYMVNIGDLQDPVLRAKYSALLKHHKSIGLIILLLVAMRFVWNRLVPRPPAAAGVTRLQSLAAKASHSFLYLTMLVVPMLGWMASMTYGGRTFFFGLFEMPVWLPKNMDWAQILQPAHIWAAWIMLGVVAVHFLAALWHHVVRRDGTLLQMLPGRKVTSVGKLSARDESDGLPG